MAAPTKVFDVIGIVVTDEFVDGSWRRIKEKGTKRVRLGTFTDFHKACAVANSILEDAKVYSRLSAGFLNGARIKDVKNAPGQVLFTAPNCAAPVAGSRDFAMDRFVEHQSETYADKPLTRDWILSATVVPNETLTRTGWSAIVQTSIATAKNASRKRPSSDDTMMKESEISNDR